GDHAGGGIHAAADCLARNTEISNRKSRERPTTFGRRSGHPLWSQHVAGRLIWLDRQVCRSEQGLQYLSGRNLGRCRYSQALALPPVSLIIAWPIGARTRARAAMTPPGGIARGRTMKSA